ncbi:MAG: hypothetical protein QGI33_01140 [Candidatus Brocadiia bacterium]|nr:hypothetical protein [Candidatus Brocadiia bacterium]
MSDSSDQAPSVDVNTKRYPAPLNPVPCGMMRQLLFDDFLLGFGSKPEHFMHAVQFSVGTVAKHGEPIFEGEKPWETSSAWISVLRDGGKFRMWYNSSHEGHSGLVVSYVESDDGIHFERPKLGAIEWRGSRENNIVYTGGEGGVSPELGNVFIDPNAGGDERYKLIHAEWMYPWVLEVMRKHKVLHGTNGTLRGAYSPDGIHWTRYIEEFLPHYPDSQNSVCWDEVLCKYVIYHRWFGEYGGLDLPGLHVKPTGRGRSVCRIESDDFRTWSTSEPVLVADMQDTLNTDIYTSAYSRHPDNPNAHYMFPSFYGHYEGWFEAQVCVSRDNRTWQRPTRGTFIPLGERGEFDSFIVSVAPGIVPISYDEWALYYRSGDGPHGPNQHIMAKMTEEEKANMASRVSRAVFKRDRVVGIEAGDEPGRFSTRPLSFEGDRLLVNVEPTGPHPELRVQLLDPTDGSPIDGYTFEKCHPITGDELDGAITWEGRDCIGPEVSREAACLHFTLRDVRIYAFEFAE